MSDLEAYIKKRKQTDPEFAHNFESGYQKFKIGTLLKLAREDAGLTQEEVAQKLNTKKSAISRMETTLRISGYLHWRNMRGHLGKL